MRDFYDALGAEEWDRFDTDIPGEVNLEIHQRFLARFVKAGDRVLEIGAGPGRFTKQLIALDTKVIVTDISQIQLELNKENFSNSRNIESWELLDICDTSKFSDGEFDIVMAYGGPLSYAFDEAKDALNDLFRILKPHGTVIGSVMSTLGTWRYFLKGALAIGQAKGEETNNAILQTGDLRLNETDHICQMYKSSDLEALIKSCRARVLAMSASNWASMNSREVLEPLSGNPESWEHFLRNEVWACEQPGALDGGTHILFAAQKG